MSVYTEIETQKIAQLCSQFGVPMSSVTPILNGVENSNWFIDADDGKSYVLTLFESRPLPEVKQLTALLNALAKHGVPVALPIAHETGLSHTNYQGKVVQITPRLPGVHPDEASALMCSDMGTMLANLHDSFLTVHSSFENNNVIDWEAKRDYYLPKLDLADKKLMYTIWQKYNTVTVSSSYDELPTGLTHADLFLDNTLWEDEQITGLLDFTEVCDDFLLMDIAITANDFCTDWQTLEFDTDKLDYLLKGYDNIRPLSGFEEKSLPIFLAMAAVRFWLFRMDVQEKNSEDQRAGANVQVKPPELMRDLAKYHLDSL